MSHGNGLDLPPEQSPTSRSEYMPLTHVSDPVLHTGSHSEADVLDKWFQRLLTYAGLPSGILFLIYHQTYLALGCFLWLACALAYVFYKQQRASVSEIQTLGLGGAAAARRPRLEGGKQATKALAPIATDTSEAHPAPNIVCLGELDEFAKFEDDVFKDIEFIDDSSIRILGAVFSNEPDPPRRVGRIDNVQAQVIYTDYDYPDFERQKIHHSYWLSEEYPSVSFEVNKVRKLIFGYIDCDKRSFTIFQNNHESASKYLPASRRMHINCSGFRIKVRLIAGEYSEWGKEFEFILKDIHEHGFTFTYLSEEEKQRERQILHNRLERLLIEGERLVTTPLVKVNWDALYNDIHSWTQAVGQALNDHSGRSLSSRFWDTSELKPYPHKIREGRDRFFDELYTRVETLKEIAREHGMPVSASNVYKEVQEVAEKRRQRIADHLEEFAARADELIKEAQQIKHFRSELIRKLYIWDADIFDYLVEYLDRTDAVLAQDTPEESAPATATRDERQAFINKVQRRLSQLRHLIEDVRAGRRTV